MKTLKAQDTAGNTYYVNAPMGTQIVKNYLFKKDDYEKTLKLHFFSSYAAMNEYADENGLATYKMSEFCRVSEGYSRDNHVYNLTR